MSACKYCGKSFEGQDLVSHIHAEHEAEYQRDLNTPLGSGKKSRYVAASSPSTSGRPHCPTCGSTNVTRFSRSWKVTKIASVGVLGLGNVHKTMHCRNCGYKW
jgi:predicted RNA-binding Zn-ribbon protein involved in translation (DUF1610 family)